MLKKIIILFTVLFLFVSMSFLWAQDDCGCCPTDDPAGDKPDDNFSFSSGTDGRFYFITPDVLIYKNGHYKYYRNPNFGEKQNAFTRLNTSADTLLKSGKVLILPTGSLFGKANDSALKNVLSEYVQKGGTLVVFTQQYNDHVEQVVPGGDSLMFYGWRQDQSCLRNSVYFETIHPVLSSSTRGIVNAGVDGYYSVYPANSTLLLKRRGNLEPTMLYYPYGNGIVILTSFYTDWAYGHSQAGASEVNIIRDLLTFAKNPHMPIPMYNLGENPTPAIALNISVLNESRETASKIKLTAYTPDRKTVLYETEANVGINSGETAAIPLNFTLPTLQTGNYGICHVDYQLYDADNNLIQDIKESDSGRFSVYNLIYPANIHDGFYQWVTVKDEKVYWGTDIECTLHFKNTTDVTRTLEVNNPFFDLGHGRRGPSFPSFQVSVAPGEEYQHPALMPTSQYDIYTKGAISLRIQYIDANHILRQIGQAKVVFLLGAMTDSSLALNGVKSNLQYVWQGEPQTFEIISRFIADPIEGNSNIKLSLEQLSRYGLNYRQESEYTEIETIYETTHDFYTLGNFHHVGTYSPIMPYGWYRLKLDVTAPNGIKGKTLYNYFYIYKSNLKMSFNIIQKTGSYLIPGESYTIPIKITNQPSNSLAHPFDVTNGCFDLILESPSGQEIFRKEMSNIQIKNGEEINLTETFTFHPADKGKYTLKRRYWDETRDEPQSYITLQYLLDGTQLSIKADKSLYNYGETANLDVSIVGAGTYHVRFTCPQAGISEERDIQVPSDTYHSTSMFQVPIGISPSFHTEVVVLDTAGRETRKKLVLVRNPIDVDYQGSFAAIQANAGSDLDFNANIKILSGTDQPIPGQLIISCSQLNFQEIRNITLQPLIDNPSSFAVPIPSEAAVGLYKFVVLLKLDGVDFTNKYYSIELPESRLEFEIPVADYNAGDTITINAVNRGGKTGHFDIQVLLRDITSKVFAQVQETRILDPGDGDSLQIIIPADIKSDRYQVFSKTINTLINSESYKIHYVNIAGLTAELNSYTLKSKYFDNEDVSGRAEVTAGTGDIDNGLVRARIIRHLESSGITVEQPGEYVAYNLIERGYSSGGKLYLSTDKGFLEYDKATGNANILYDFADTNVRVIFPTSGGEIWVGTSFGVYRRDNSGTWEQFTSSTVLQDNLVYDIQEADFNGNPSVWVANRGGIAVFSSGTWTSLTSSNGLPSDRVYALAKDETGAVWASTSGGVVRYNGTTFESVSAPFGTGSVSENLASGLDGSVWMIYSYNLYRYSAGEWTTWTRAELYPDASIYFRQIEAVGNNIWLRADFWDGDYQRKLLIRTDGTATVFINTEIQGLTGLDLTPIMPGNADGGDDAWFACEFGFLRYDGDTWTDKEISIDADKLPSEIRTMHPDSNGTIWAGTQYGLSMYDGSKWINCASSTDNRLLTDVYSMSIDTSNRVYGFTSGGVVKITGTSAEIIDYTTALYNLGFYPYYDTKIAVDGSGRIWLGRDRLYYHDPLDGLWHEYTAVRYVRVMETDPAGGIWVGSWNDYSEFHLQHIKSDLSLDDYTTSNSELIPWEKDRLYMDPDGILWIKHHVDNWDDIRYLQSFDGQTWVNYSNYDGFPQYGVIDFVKDGDGRLIVVDRDGNLHTLDNNQFSPGQTGINFSHSLVYSNGRLHYAGGEPYYAGEPGWITPSYFVTLSSEAGLSEKEVWRQTYSLNLSSGGNITLDLLPGMNLPAGSYVLKTELLSSLEQELARSSNDFIVRESGISVSISGDNEGNPYVKSGSTVNTAIEILNNTSGDFPNLIYMLKKQSPSGIVEIVRNQALSITSGGTYTDNMAFVESETGTWHLIAELYEEGSGGGEEPGGEVPSGPMLPPQSSGTPISQSELILQVSEPNLAVEILSPEYAGDDPFNVEVKLSNQGLIPALCNVTITGAAGETDETVTINPHEERIFSLTDTIAADRIYTINVSGDVEQSETRIVKYGYVENFSLDVLPSYREGAVTIAYQISNSGGLAFRDDLHFELYTVGGSIPLYTIDKSCNLYPAAEVQNDNLEFFLAPGNYRLTYRTSKTPTLQEALFSVQPSGIGTVSYTDKTYPIGLNDIVYSITNTDTTTGQIPVNITIYGAEPSSPLFTETREYYLEPGETLEDFISYEFSQKGTYTLALTGSKIANPINPIIQVLNLEEVSANLSVGTAENHLIPITIDMTNSGYNPFGGILLMEASGIQYEIPIAVPPNSSFNETFGFVTAALTEGPKEVKVYLYDTSGNILSQTTTTVQINGPDIKIIDFTDNLEIDAGSYAEVTVKLKNEGNLRAEALLKVTAFDTLYEEREIGLEPGKEIEIQGLYIDAPPDMPTGHYPFNYILSGSGVQDGLFSGNFTFKVNGLSLDVDASLDRSLYNEGETAQLTLTITCPTASEASLEAAVNWGNFSENRLFTLVSGSASLVFDIPLDEKRDEKIFYGIYHEGGKGIHLNDIYLYFRDELTVETDKQVYEPGDTINAVFSSDQDGTLTLQAFDETQTLPLTSSTSTVFQVPQDTVGGTYGISWRFVPSDTSRETISGTHLFDVEGLIVTVVKSELEKGKYAPGEIINAIYTFESNRNDTLELNCLIRPPSGEWISLGESNVAVSSDSHITTVSSYSFDSTEAGTHIFIYGLYKDGQFVLTGSMAFDVGDAVLMGISTDQFEYMEGNETVNVAADYFGEGTAQLELFLDDVQVDVRSLTISGVGSTVIPLSADTISGGSHTLKAVITKDGLTSTKTTTFLYGTSLPDLTVHLNDTTEEGLNYTFVVETANGGKTASAATSLSFSDNGTTVQTFAVPALQPGENHEITVQWSGSGKAGSHEFTFETDSTQTVKEYSESNNNLSFTREVPVMFYTLEVEPVIWPANSDITIITRVINNRDGVTPVTLDLSITSEMTNEIIFQRSHTEELPAFGSKTISDIFAVGVYPAGDYTLAQSLNSSDVSLHEQISVIIEATKAMEAVLSLQPQTIPAGTSSDVELTMNFTNAGNVSLDEETVVIEVVDKESDEIVKSDDIIVSVPIGQTVSETKVMALSLAEGAYAVRLKYLDGVITSADLTAAGGLEREKTIDIRPRVLLMNLNTPVKHANHMAFLASLFQSQGISFESGDHILESFFKLHKGYSNVSVVLGDMMGQNLRRELKERVWSGEGLIIMPDKAGNNPEWRDFLGVRVNTVPGKDRERDIRLLESEISAPGELRLVDKNKLSLVKLSDDVLVIAETAAKKQPVMTLRKYGSGYVLVSVLPLEIEIGMEQVSQLFVNAVNVFSRDIYSACQLTRLVPIKLLLTNETVGEKTVTVKENLPYGVEGFDYVPAPVEDTEDDILKWNLTLEAGETVSVTYWLKLPDQVNTYDIVSEIYEGETKRDEVSLSFEVTQTIISRIDEMLLELETLDVSGADARAVRKAMNYLQQVRSGGDNLLQMLRSLHFSVWACDELSRVEHADVSSLRLRAVEIVRIMGRGVYDSIKQWGASRLTPFMQMIAVE